MVALCTLSLYSLSYYCYFQTSIHISGINCGPKKALNYTFFYGKLIMIKFDQAPGFLTAVSKLFYPETEKSKTTIK
jgi:hypothetical protein